MQSQVIPGILEKEWDQIETKLEQIKTFTTSAHIDITDGKFVNNKTFLDPEPFKKYSSDIFFELHMMVENPEGFIEPWGKAGFRRFLGHIEYMSSQKEFVEQAKKYGEAGIALDGPTHISRIKIPFKQFCGQGKQEPPALFQQATSGNPKTPSNNSKSSHRFDS